MANNNKVMAFFVAFKTFTTPKKSPTGFYIIIGCLFFKCFRLFKSNYFHIAKKNRMQIIQLKIDSFSMASNCIYCLPNNSINSIEERKMFGCIIKRFNGEIRRRENKKKSSHTHTNTCTSYFHLFDQFSSTW